MVFHGTATVLVLDKPHHSLIALRVKLIVVISLNIMDLFGPQRNRVRSDVLFERILIVRNKPLSIFQLNFESLVVEREPAAFDRGPGAYPVLTLFSLSRHILIEVDFHNIISLEVELKFFVKHL